MLYQNFSKKYFCQFKRRVVVTGMGMLTPLGLNKEETWKNLIDKKSGIRDLSDENFSKDLPSTCKYGAMIPKDFDGRRYRTLVSITLILRIKI
jgi:3-oxoacyl-(acyl-carrier-protein) synthase